MAKTHYPWWSYVKYIVQQYPKREHGSLPSVVQNREVMAVGSAIFKTEQMDGGDERMKVIRMVHFDRTHTLSGAALEIPCDRATAARWQRKFFEDVARNRGLID